MRALRLVSLLATLVASLALAACGDESGGGGDPRQTIDAATLNGIQSGRLDLSLSVDARGREGGDLQVALSGPFQGAGKGELPQVDLDFTASGSAGDQELDFEGGLVLLANSAYVNYQGVEYEVDPTSFSFIEATLDPEQEGRPGSEVACQEAVGSVRISSLIDNLRGGEAADVEGTETTKVSGDLDAGAALDTLLGLAEDPACRTQTAVAGELPSRAEVRAAQREIEQGLKDARIEVYVGEDDIVRQISADLQVEPGQRSQRGPRSADIEFDLRLTEVNEEQDIAAPERTKPLSDLFAKLGVNPLDILLVLQGQGGESLGSLLEGIGRTAGGDSAGGRSGADERAFLKCLREARTPVDLQECIPLAG